MKGIKGIAIALVLLGSFLLMQGTAAALPDYADCCMTGGGMLFGRFQAGPATFKTMVVNYGMLLSCPEVGTIVISTTGSGDYEVMGPEPIEPMGPNVLSVVWAGSNRFVMKNLVYSSCDEDNVKQPARKLPSNISTGFNTIKGKGTGTYNWVMSDYMIEFEFIDGKKTGMRDWAHIIIKTPSNQVILDAQGYISAGGQAAHCPIEG
jgi:hypothetical protein